MQAPLPADLTMLTEDGPPGQLANLDSERRRPSTPAPPLDDASPKPPDAATKSAIQAMRIINVAAPVTDLPPIPAKPPVDDEDEGEEDEYDDEDELEVPASAPDELDDVEEVVPDSAEELDDVEPVSLQPEEVADAVPAKPPPPPPRRRKTGDTKPSQPPKKKKRPWWEELFGDDYQRANTRLTPNQIGREVDFIEKSLGVAAGGVVLDLACGSGEHAVELASRGYGVVGYDLSISQLALAADVAQDRAQKLNFLQGDMREMAFEQMFDGVYSWNTSFGYFEEEKNILVAQRVFNALRPGGTFLLDVVNRDYVSNQSPCSVWYEGDACVCMDDMQVDYITSRLKVKRTMMFDDGRNKELNYSVRLYGLHELGRLLHGVGFRIAEASGHTSMPGVFFGASSPRIIILAERPADS